jgi:ankyrin repeat protein
MDTPTRVEDILRSVSDVLFPSGLGEREVRLDSRGSDGDTPLHVLAWRKDLDGIQALIQAGADVNAIGDMGETPFHVAMHDEFPGAIELFIKAGANPDIVSEFGQTPRSLALAIGGATAETFERLAPNYSLKRTNQSLRD